MPKRAPTRSWTRILGAVAAGLVIASLAGCDTEAGGAVPGPNGPAPRQVTVVGTGKVQGTPDTVTINAGIQSAAIDATSALNRANERMSAVLDAVKKQGIDDKDVNTTDVSLQPQYGENSVITAYQASNTIAVKVRKVEAASPTISAIQAAGGDATRINSVAFSIDDDSQLVKDARTRAFNDAKDRAAQYAQLSGLDLGKVISISEVGATVPPPTPMPRFGAAAEGVPLAPGQQTVGFSVTVVWALG